jgi:hypothetical protein
LKLEWAQGALEYVTIGQADMVGNPSHQSLESGSPLERTPVASVVGTSSFQVGEPMGTSNSVVEASFLVFAGAGLEFTSFHSAAIMKVLSGW